MLLAWKRSLTELVWLLPILMKGSAAIETLYVRYVCKQYVFVCTIGKRWNWMILNIVPSLRLCENISESFRDCTINRICLRQTSFNEKTAQASRERSRKTVIKSFLFAHQDGNVVEWKNTQIGLGFCVRTFLIVFTVVLTGVSSVLNRLYFEQCLCVKKLSKWCSGSK